MEDRSTEMTCRALDVADMTRELAEFAVTIQSAEVQPTRGIPRKIKRRRLGARGEFFLERRCRIDDVESELEVVIDRFARDEQSHDLRRSLEDQVDPEIPHRALDRNRRLTATRQ